jgi:hypothetical protein
MRALVPTVALACALVLSGCRSTYHARADDLRWPTPTADVVPALDDDGEAVRLRVDSILRAYDRPGNMQEAVAADGRASTAIGLGVLGAAAGWFVLGGYILEEEPLSVVGTTTTAVLVALPFLAYGLIVGSPEE